MYTFVPTCTYRGASAHMGAGQRGPAAAPANPNACVWGSPASRPRQAGHGGLPTPRLVLAAGLRVTLLPSGLALGSARTPRIGTWTFWVTRWAFRVGRWTLRTSNVSSSPLCLYYQQHTVHRVEGFAQEHS